MDIQAALNDARPQAPDFSATSRVVLPRGVYEISEPLRIPGGVHLVGDGRVELRAIATMDAMVIIEGDFAGNLFGSYMGGVESLTLNGQNVAWVGLRTGMIANYLFRQLRVVDCLDAGAHLSQIQNSLFELCVFERNGGGLGALACGLRLADGAQTNRFVACQMAQNYQWQMVLCDERGITADGGTSPTNDLPAGVSGPTQNLFLHCMIEEYSGRSRGLIYARAGEDNVFDLCKLSHVGGVGPIDMIRLTSEDAPLPLPTAAWLLRDCTFHGGGPGYVGVRAAGTWDIRLRDTRWGSVDTHVFKDQAGAVVEVPPS